MLAHGTAGGHFLEQLAAFGTDWLYLLVPSALFLGVGVALVVAGRRAGTPGIVRAFAAGAERATGVPGWSSGGLAVLAAGLVIAVIGFFWDVAWHIGIGRDEFLFSPPHVCLLVGLALIGVAGIVSVVAATADGADVGWRLGRRRVPFGAAALVIAGGSALLGFAVDELWHASYGLDVTMWSPPHLTMISAAAFSGIAGWLLHAEAGPRAGRPGARRFLRGFLAGVLLTALSAWQLEFDLGVPQWPQLSQVVLIAAAGAFALVTARAALGRGGALIAVANFLGIRVVLHALTVGAWGLSAPRFPLHLAAAVAVELAFLRPRSTAVGTALVAGAGVGTLGLAGTWLVSQVWLPHAWQLHPRLLVGTVVAVAAGVLGMAFGRAVSHRATGMRRGALALAGVVVLAGLGMSIQRRTPEGTLTVHTRPAGEGFVHVRVEVDPPALVSGADRWGVMAWQGRGHVDVALERSGDGTWRTTEPVPVGGDWKTLVRYAEGPALGGVPVWMPADPQIDAEEIPLVERRVSPIIPEEALLLREAHEGPRWPALVAYAFVAASLVALIGTLAAGTVALDRRRRAHGWRRDAGSLEGRRIVLTGAAGGIGRAARAALEGQGAFVVGLDLLADRPDTIAVDVSDADAVTAAVGEAVTRLGGLDVVVANAGIGIAADSTTPPRAAAERVLEVNLMGAWRTIAAAVPHLADDGRIVAVSSGLAVATVPYSAAYTASKRGLSGLLDVLRVETGHTVTEVRPAYIATAIHDQPAASGASLSGVVREETVADAAAAIVAACETRRRSIASSPRLALELWLASRVPVLADRVVARQLARVERRRGAPDFTGVGS